MYFNKQQLEEIKQSLLLEAVKDTSFPKARLPLNSSEEIVLIQDGVNVKSNLVETLEKIYKFRGYYLSEEKLIISIKNPREGDYAYVGSSLDTATVYICSDDLEWYDTLQSIEDYVKIYVQGAVSVGVNGNWYNGKIDTGIKAKGEDGEPGKPGPPGPKGDDGSDYILSDDDKKYIALLVGDEQINVHNNNEESHPHINKEIKRLEEVINSIPGISESEFLRKDGISQESNSKTTFNKEILIDNLSSKISKEDIINGKGYIIKINPDGTSYAEFDNVAIRKNLTALKLTIQEIEVEGGIKMQGSAIMQVSDIIDLDILNKENLLYKNNTYRLYFDTKNGKISNQFKIGDQIRCHRVNVNSDLDISYYWRVVNGIGVDYIDVYKNNVNTFEKPDVDNNNVILIINREVDYSSSIPKVNDVICGCGSISDPKRMAYKITRTIGENAPIEENWSYVNDFYPSRKFNLTKDENAKNITYLSDYITFKTRDGGVIPAMLPPKKWINGIVSYYPEQYGWLGSTWLCLGNGITSEPSNENSDWLLIIPRDESIDEALKSANEAKNYIESVLPNELGELQRQIDGQINSFFYSYDPTLNNIPASEWITDAEKEVHLRDTFTNLITGSSWRFVKNGNTYSWLEIADTATKEALRLASLAKDTADGKRRVFISEPTTPYDKGDLWSQGLNGDLMVCITGKSTGSYSVIDWDKASKYTDDTVANDAKNKAELAQISINAMNDDNIFDVVEKQVIRTQWEAIQGAANATADGDPSGSYKKTIAMAAAKVSTTNLTILYTTLRTYLNGVSLYTNNNTASFVRTTMANHFKNYYNEEVAVLDKISKGYVDAIEIGGVNLVLNSAKRLETNTYQMGEIFLSKELKDDEIITISVYGKLSAGKNVYVGLYPSSAVLTILKPNAEGNYVGTIAFKKNATYPNDLRNRFGIYNSPNSGDFVGYIDKIKIEKGNKATDWSASPKDIEQEINIAKTAANTANTAVGNLNTYVDGAFKDGVIDTSEAKAIGEQIKNINETKAQADSSYATIYANPLLSGTAKTNLATTQNDLDTKRTTLITAINNIVTNKQVTTPLLTAYNTAYTNYTSSYSTFAQRLTEATKFIEDAIKAQADKGIADAAVALAAANKAQADANASVADYNAKFATIQAQVDGEVSNWYYPYSPTLSNAPANSWLNDTERNRHIGDTFLNTQPFVNNATTPDAGKAWRYVKNGAVYSWTAISDSDAVKALQNAAKAQSTADGKSTTYIVKPTKYAYGDMWVLESDAVHAPNKQGEVLFANTTSAVYLAAHWVTKVRYTDDTVANDAKNRADLAQTAISAMNDDSVFDVVEKQVIRTQWEAIQGAPNTTVDGDLSGSYKKTIAMAGSTVSTTNLTTLYTTLRTYLNGVGLYINNNTASFVRTTMANHFKNYYNDEVVVLDKISKGYVDSIEIGGMNLFNNTNEKPELLQSGHTKIICDDPSIAGKTVTISMEFEPINLFTGVNDEPAVLSGFTNVKAVNTDLSGAAIVIELEINADRDGYIEFYPNGGWQANIPKLYFKPGYQKLRGVFTMESGWTSLQLIVPSSSGNAQVIWRERCYLISAKNYVEFYPKNNGSYKWDPSQPAFMNIPAGYQKLVGTFYIKPEWTGLKMVLPGVTGPRVIWKQKLEIGNKATDWSPSTSDSRLQEDNLAQGFGMKDAKTLSSNLVNLKNNAPIEFISDGQGGLSAKIGTLFAKNIAGDNIFTNNLIALKARIGTIGRNRVEIGSQENGAVNDNTIRVYDELNSQRILLSPNKVRTIEEIGTGGINVDMPIQSYSLTYTSEQNILSNINVANNNTSLTLSGKLRITVGKKNNVKFSILYNNIEIYTDTIVNYNQESNFLDSTRDILISQLVEASSSNILKLKAEMSDDENIFNSVTWDYGGKLNVAYKQLLNIQEIGKNGRIIAFSTSSYVAEYLDQNTNKIILEWRNGTGGFRLPENGSPQKLIGTTWTNL